MPYNAETCRSVGLRRREDPTELAFIRVFLDNEAVHNVAAANALVPEVSGVKRTRLLLEEGNTFCLVFVPYSRLGGFHRHHARVHTPCRG